MISRLGRLAGVDEERRRIQIAKQRIGLGFFPSTIVHEAELVYEGNRESWAALKRAEETYVAQVPSRRGRHGNVRLGQGVLAEALIQQSLTAMLEITTIFLDDPGAAQAILGELTRRVESYYQEQERARRPE